MSTLKATATCISVSLFLFCLGCGVVAIPIAPSISQVLPRTVTAGSKGLTMTVVGKNFTKGAVILWNGKSLPTSVVDSATLAAQVQSSSLAAPAVVQLNVQDTQTGAESNAASLTVTSDGSIPPAPAVIPALEISTPSLPVSTVGTSYNAGLTATGGTPAYTWSLTSGELPKGMSLSASSGVISGTPTVSGTFSFSVTVTDAGSPAQSAKVALMMLVNGNTPSTPTPSTPTPSTPTPPSPLKVSSNLAGATVGQSYRGSLSVAGGTAPYTWSITSGQLPGGLSLSASSGVISGVPAKQGNYSFTATATDSSSPAQVASETVSIAATDGAVPVTPSLTITTSSLPAGSSGTAYSAALKASGGTPAYTWSISAGTLPAGLTLAATTGTISGTPTAAGTAKFTATVSDNSNPAKTQSVATSITVGEAQQPTGPGTTWYVRPDGGTRYSADMPNGQCDGQADAAYSGSGTNQHCAFNDFRWLYDSRGYNNDAWVISGGDTVILRGGPWRIGWDANTGPGGGDTWCLGRSNVSCYNPQIPAGTPTQHTRILGENYQSCGQAKMTQLFGGYGVPMALNLTGAQYVDVECVELTRHSECIQEGTPAEPGLCNKGNPMSALDDYASNGIVTDVHTHDVLLQDMWIHGFTSTGIIGPIGGVVTAERVDIAYNGGAGWDFDDGGGTPNPPGSVWNFKDSIIEYSGCNQAYPGTGAVSCYDQDSGGYGDGVGTPAGTCLTVNIDHSIFRYNTQDGLDLGHIDTGTCTLTITNSTAYGNMGGTFKWGPNENPAVFENNTVVANCLRMSAPITGQPSTYNAHLSDFCRAQDALPFDFRQGGTVTFINNSIVTYAPTTFDIGCWDPSCSSSTLIFRNNIVLGFDNPATYSRGGQPGGPGLFNYQHPIGNVDRSNNVYMGIGHNFSCPTGYTEFCEDPLFSSEPAWTGEASLDNFNFLLSAGSPAIGAGLYIPNLLHDYTGLLRANPPSVGAYER